MSRIRSVESLALAGVVLVIGAGCTKAADVQGPKMAPTSIATTIKPIESDGALFERASCNKGEITFPKPMGWNFLEVSVTPNFTNCYASKGSLNREEDFKNGLAISRLVSPLSSQDRITSAKELASRPSRDLLPVANTFQEAREGVLTVFSGRFVGARGNVYIREERKIYVGSSNEIFIIAYSSPEPIAEEDFKKFGNHILSGIQIKPKSNL